MRIAILVALLLAGCAAAPVDPYQAEPTVRCPTPRTVFQVRIVPVPLHAVANTCLSMSFIHGGKAPPPGMEHGACSLFVEARNELQIWAAIPLQVDDLKRMAFIGHELLHGVCDRPGRQFHD